MSASLATMKQIVENACSLHYCPRVVPFLKKNSVLVGLEHRLSLRTSASTAQITVDKRELILALVVEGTSASDAGLILKPVSYVSMARHQLMMMGIIVQLCLPTAGFLFSAILPSAITVRITIKFRLMGLA